MLASGHQAAFARWLGLHPVATYSGAEKASPARIDALLAKGASSNARFVVANQQEGTHAAKALALQLNVPVVVFSNFPSMDESQRTFDDLVRANLAQLLRVAAEQSGGSAL